MNINEFINQPFTFNKRKRLFPIEIRATWKASLLLLMFSMVSRSQTCSLKKLHVANWVIKSHDHLNEFIRWTSDFGLNKPDIRLEPSLDCAVEILVSEGLLIKHNGKIKLTERGSIKAKQIEQLDVLKPEKERLQQAKKLMTETNVEKIFKVV